MNSAWILVMTFWIGSCAGFLLFALMQVARESSDDGQGDAEQLSLVGNDRD